LREIEEREIERERLAEWREREIERGDGEGVSE
jgi:hypothetical protein